MMLKNSRLSRQVSQAQLCPAAARLTCHLMPRSAQTRRCIAAGSGKDSTWLVPTAQPLPLAALGCRGSAASDLASSPAIANCEGASCAAC